MSGLDSFSFPQERTPMELSGVKPESLYGYGKLLLSVAGFNVITGASRNASPDVVFLAPNPDLAKADTREDLRRALETIQRSNPDLRIRIIEEIPAPANTDEAVPEEEVA